MARCLRGPAPRFGPPPDTPTGHGDAVHVTHTAWRPGHVAARAAGAGRAPQAPGHVDHRHGQAGQDALGQDVPPDGSATRSSPPAASGRKTRRNARTTTRCEDDLYVANITLQHVQKRVAALYAKNPRARRARSVRGLLATVWDGSLEMPGAGRGDRSAGAGRIDGHACRRARNATRRCCWRARRNAQPPGGSPPPGVALRPEGRPAPPACR